MDFSAKLDQLQAKTNETVASARAAASRISPVSARSPPNDAAELTVGPRGRGNLRLSRSPPGAARPARLPVPHRHQASGGR